ncbi:MAG: hypothetical protein LBJ64_07645 [Deltaproteobacteria bacterium]|jgi:hypothetical protein|nr:hypothetical protein [Deltaproteobacteria bacterium]
MIFGEDNSGSATTRADNSSRRLCLAEDHGLAKGASLSKAEESIRRKLDDISGVLDLPRFQGLYRALETVTLPASGQKLPRLALVDDLPDLYPEAIQLTLSQREELLGRLRRLMADSQAGAKVSQLQKANLEGEILKLDRRLYLHNRRCRGAHLDLAEKMGRGWPDWLHSLFSALHFFEKIKTDLERVWAFSKQNSNKKVLQESLDSLVGSFGRYVKVLEPHFNSLVNQVSSQADVFSSWADVSAEDEGAGGTVDGSVSGASGGTSGATSTGTLGGASDGTLGGTSGEASDGTLGGTSNGTLGGASDGTLGGASDGTFDGTVGGTSGEASNGTIGGTPNGTLGRTSSETSNETSGGTSNETPSGTSHREDDRVASSTNVSEKVLDELDELDQADQADQADKAIQSIQSAQSAQSGQADQAEQATQTVHTNQAGQRIHAAQAARIDEKAETTAKDSADPDASGGEKKDESHRSLGWLADSSGLDFLKFSNGSDLALSPDSTQKSGVLPDGAPFFSSSGSTGSAVSDDSSTSSTTSTSSSSKGPQGGRNLFLSFLAQPALSLSLNPLSVLLLSEAAALPTKAPAGRRNLTEYVQKLSNIFGYFRTLFLIALVQGEELLLTCRHHQFALPKAPAPLPAPVIPASYTFSTEKKDAKIRAPRKKGFALLTMALLAVAFFAFMNGGSPRRGTMHVYNGLAAPVTVSVNEVNYFLQAGGSVPVDMPDVSDMRVSARSKDSLIETFFDVPKIGDNESLVYNVNGASPLMEWQAVYAPDPNEEPPSEKLLGAPTFLKTKADFVLVDPPRTIRLRGRTRTKVILSGLSGVHPARMLNILSTEQRTPVIEAQARWNLPGALWTPLWLDLLASNSPKAISLLEARLGDFPKDPWTAGYFLKISPKGRSMGLCLDFEAQAAADPEDPGPAYLASLCLPLEERSQRLGELLKIWPHDPWLNRAAGWERYASDDLEGALWYLGAAFEDDPSILLPELETLARLRRFSGALASALSAEFSFWVPGLAELTRREMIGSLAELGQELEVRTIVAPESASQEDQAYALLERGRLKEAVLRLPQGEARDRLSRLAAGSDGATEELVSLALALPNDRGLDRNTAWVMLGLALRLGAPSEVYERVVVAESPPPAEQIVEALKEGNVLLLPGLIAGAEAWLQGQACVAVEAAGLTPPEKCPEKARGFLFPGERPYLEPVKTSAGAVLPNVQGLSE